MATSRDYGGNAMNVSRVKYDIFGSVVENVVTVAPCYASLVDETIVGFIESINQSINQNLFI